MRFSRRILSELATELCSICVSCSFYLHFTYYTTPINILVWGKVVISVSLSHKGIAWSQKERNLAVVRQLTNKKYFPYIPHSSRGLRYFFVRQAFSFSLGLTHHPAKDNS